MAQVSIEPVAERIADLTAYTYVVMRVGLGLTMAGIGVHKLFINTKLWVSYIAPVFDPIFAVTGVSPGLFMQLTGIGELVLGLLLAANIAPVTVAGLLTIFMAGIVANLIIGGISLSITLRDVAILVLSAATMLQAAEEQRK